LTTERRFSTARRRAAGERSAYIFHTPVDKNIVTAWFDSDTMENAKALTSDPALARGMPAAGVISTPQFPFPNIDRLN
jgi:hypothetical protein